MSNTLVEIRDYTIDPERFDAYREWAKNLEGPWVKENLDLIDIWLDEELE
ncbi:hypothetical protein OAK06_06500 [Gammaproteobacteria bacterium]|nr:hypothetical protein [Gammaproteobacteria bacterium]